MYRTVHTELREIENEYNNYEGQKKEKKEEEEGFYFSSYIKITYFKLALKLYIS